MTRSFLAFPALCLVLSVAPFVSAAQQQQPATSALDFASLGRDTVNELAARQFVKVYARFGQAAASAISAEKLGQIWDSLLAQEGPFQKTYSVSLAVQAGYHIASVTCAFEKGSLDIVLAFDPSGRLVGLHFAPPNSSLPAAIPWNAPSYADPSTFHEVDLAISDGQWHLPGTLTLPNGKGPFSAVVLVSGSGPNDGDETIGPNKPVKDLAWGLASEGIAVLRYPKRTHVYGGGSAADPQNFTVRDEYIDDVRAAVALLAGRPDINPKRIFLAGHSEGGYLAPRIAAGVPQIAGIIILEGNTRPIEQLVIAQLRYEANLGGPNAAQIEKMIPEAQQQAKIIESPELKPGTEVQMLTATVPSSYFLDLRSYDPAATAASLKIPIYVTQGGRDYQVTATDFTHWKKALAGHSNATLKLYPSLNHLLIAGSGPSSPVEYEKPAQHVSPEIIHDLSSWIQSQH